jgi:hypothetical protein
MYYAEKKWSGEPLDELKPCPFCGGQAGLIHRGNDHTETREVTVRCRTRGCCKGMTVAAVREDMSWCEERAVEHWNKRT